jgi:hypothetical protein
MDHQSAINEGLLAGVADEYLARLKRGELPRLEAYTARCPELAQDLADLFATLQAVNAAKAEETERFEALDEELVNHMLGDFRIIREIGRGGLGTVYEAEQLSLGRWVALKVLPLAALLEPRLLRRFKNEAQAAAQLHHNHIVPVHAVGCERGVHYYALAYIEGSSLAEVIAELRRSEHGEAATSSDKSRSARRLARRLTVPNRCWDRLPGFVAPICNRQPPRIGTSRWDGSGAMQVANLPSNKVTSFFRRLHRATGLLRYSRFQIGATCSRPHGSRSHSLPS